MLYPLSYMGTLKMFRFYTNKSKQMPLNFLPPVFHLPTFFFENHRQEAWILWAATTTVFWQADIALIQNFL